MTEIVQLLNDELAEVARGGRQSLVTVRNRSEGGGAGSGVIIHPMGLIVTNAHVVGHGVPEVELNDGTVFEAKVLAADSDHDLVALSVEREGLPWETRPHSSLATG